MKASTQNVGFVLLCCSYGLRLNQERAGWSGCELGITTASTNLFSLCRWDGWLQRRAAFYRSATVSVAVQKIGREFLHPMGRVSSIVTNSSLLSCEEKNNPIFGSYQGRIAMQEKISLTPDFRIYTTCSAQLCDKNRHFWVHTAYIYLSF